MTTHFNAMRKTHEQRKTEIIQTALVLAAELGVKKVTTQVIADKIGVSQATIFRHFKTRELIFVLAIEWLSGQMYAQLSPYFSDNTQLASTRLNLLIERQMNFIAENKGLPRLLFSDQLHLESSALKEAVQNVMQGYITQVQRLLQEGIDEGVFKAKINTQASAKLVAALIQGTVMRWSIFDYTFNLNDEIEPIQSIVTAALQSNSYSRSTN